MIFPDYHLHSFFSSDSQAFVDDIIISAKNKGMSSMCITDHYDMDFPVLPSEPDMTFDLDTDKYLVYMNEVKDRYSKDFDFRIGVELGIMKETQLKLHDYVEKYSQFDFIIASSHLVDGLDPYYPEYFQGKTEYEAYYHYFETILDNVKNFKGYNVYGHLDYIFRYGPNKDSNFALSDYYDLFKDILETIIYDGKGIEINTGSLYKGMSSPHPNIDILKLYKSLGGEIITVGSDAHKPDYVGYGFDIAKDILLSNGFKYYTTFSNMKPGFKLIQ